MLKLPNYDYISQRNAKQQISISLTLTVSELLCGVYLCIFCAFIGSEPAVQFHCTLVPLSDIYAKLHNFLELGHCAILFFPSYLPFNIIFSSTDILRFNLNLHHFSFELTIQTLLALYMGQLVLFGFIFRVSSVLFANIHFSYCYEICDFSVF